jgi:hypothetical protein
MPVINFPEVSDSALKILAGEVFIQVNMQSIVDRTLREGVLKQVRLRAPKSVEEKRALFGDPLISLVWLPELRSFELLAASLSLAAKINQVQRAALEAIVNKDADLFQARLDCTKFLVDVVTRLHEIALVELKREKSRVN